jgi:hypothetical protein
MNNSFFVSMSVVALFHAEDFWADLCADFTADTAVWVNRWCALHICAPDE